MHSSPLNVAPGTNEDPYLRPRRIDAAFWLVSGDILHRLLGRMGLFEPQRRAKCFLLWVTLTWFPLVILSLGNGTAVGNQVKIPLLLDFSIYCRFFVALPLLIASELVIDPFLCQVAATFESSTIIKEKDRPLYGAILKEIASLSDSNVASGVLISLACVPCFLFVAHYEWMTSSISTWHRSTSEGFSLAGWWFVIFSSPVIRFVMLRRLWRYALWIRFLWRVSHLDLSLVPTHPDRLGGLGFLLNTQQHFGVLATALSAVLSGQLANGMTYFGERFSNIRAQITVFIVSAVFAILLPLTLFSFKLFRVRRDGLVRYSGVARNVTTAFDVKWAQRTSRPPDSMIGSEDPSSLIDFISSYDVIRQTQVIPITKIAVLHIAGMAAAPFLLVWLLATPSERVITEILKRVL